MNIKKKGNIFDVPETIMVVFAIVLSLFVVYTILTNFGSEIKRNDEMNITSLTTAYDDHTEILKNSWDYGFLLILILFPIVSFLLARKIPVNPTVVIITIIISPIIIIIAMVMSNVHGGMMDNSTYLAFINSTTFIRFLMPKMGIYSIIYLGLVMFGLYGKDE